MSLWTRLVWHLCSRSGYPSEGKSRPGPAVACSCYFPRQRVVALDIAVDAVACGHTFVGTLPRDALQLAGAPGKALQVPSPLSYFWSFIVWVPWVRM